MSCIVCDGELSGKQRKYCSNACKQQNKYSNIRNCGKDKYKHQCVICGEGFYSNYKKGKYCSKECSKHAANLRRRRLPEVRECAYCGKPSGRRKYCSRTCQRRVLGSTTYTHICISCGKEWVSFNKNAKYCSNVCYNIVRPQPTEHIEDTDYRKIKGKTNIREKMRKRNRKPRLRQATPDWISLDGFVEIELKREPGQEIDHIVPINHPLVCGLNVPWNLQILRCEVNNFKSNKFDGTNENEGWIDEYREYRRRK